MVLTSLKNRQFWDQHGQKNCPAQRCTRNDPNFAKSSKTYIIDLMAPFGLFETYIFMFSYFLNFQDPGSQVRQLTLFHTTSKA